MPTFTIKDLINEKHNMDKFQSEELPIIMESVGYDKDEEDKRMRNIEARIIFGF